MKQRPKEVKCCRIAKSIKLSLRDSVEKNIPQWFFLPSLRTTCVSQISSTD